MLIIIFLSYLRFYKCILKVSTSTEWIYHVFPATYRILLQISVDSISFNLRISSSVRVIPLPIFSWSGAQSRRSYLGMLSFQDTRFSSFVHPFLLSQRTPISFTILNFISLAINFFLKFSQVFSVWNLPNTHSIWYVSSYKICCSWCTPKSHVFQENKISWNNAPIIS